MARPLVPALVLLAALAAVSVHGSLIAVDLGSEFLKVSLIKPGRTPIAVVVNEMSKRKSPALVGFSTAGERLLGEEAFSFAVRYPDTTFMRARDLLGKSADDPSISAMLKGHSLPYKVVPHPVSKMAALQVKGGLVHSAEEIVGSMLQYAKQIAEEQSGSAVVDAVIAVPAYFGQAQRQGIVDSANLVGLNVLGLINTHTAAALQFGIERDFANKTQHVVFYDMGSGGTVVALVRYSSYVAKDSPGKPISQLEVKDVDWDADLGANQLDALLSEHFAKAFAEKNKLDVAELLGNARSMAKLKKQVRRTKEMLSANTAAPISVEELHDGKDFQSSITREQFEELAGGFFTSAAAPLERILKRSGLKPEEIDFIELLGGGTRVPRLQSALSEVLGGRTLDRHVDADEGVVLGASLFAANLSTSFRLRKFGLADVSMYGISLRVDEAHEPAADAANPAAPVVAADGADAGEAGSKERNLLPYLKRLPVKRVVHFTNLTRDPLSVSLHYNTTTAHPLPPGAKGPELASFKVTGIDTVVKRYHYSGTVNLKFEASYDGLVSLSKAEAVVEYWVTETKQVLIKPPPAAANATANTTANVTTGAANSTAPSESKGDKEEAAEDKEAEEKQAEGEGEEGKEEEQQQEEEEAGGAGGGAAAAEEGEDGAAAAGEAEAPSAADAEGASKKNETAPKEKEAPKYETVTVVKKKLAKVQLNVSTQWSVAPLAGEQLKASKAVVAAWVSAELAKRQTAAAKNELESYIIRLTEQMQDEEGKLGKVTSAEQRASFLKQLSEAEEWLYTDGEAEGLQAFKKKLADLQKVGGPMEARAEEAEQRPEAVSATRKDAELKLSAAGLWAETKPWITEEERTDVEAKVKAFLTWLEGKEEAQGKKQPHEEPAYLLKDLAAEYDKMDKVYSKVANKKKPKPPPEPPAPANATANGTAGGNSTNPTGAESEAGADGSQADGKDPKQQKQQEGASSAGEGKAGGKQQAGGGDGKKGEKKDEGSSGKGGGGKKPAAGGQQEDKKAKAKREAEEKAAKAKKDKEAKAKKEKEDKARKEKDAKAQKQKKAGGKSDKEL